MFGVPGLFSSDDNDMIIPEFIRKGSILGGNIGLYETNNFLSNIEIRTINVYKKIFKVLRDYFSKYE